MGIKEITFDVADWPRNVVDALLSEGRRLDTLVKGIGSKPDGFEERYEKLRNHADQWDQDRQRFLREHPDTPDYLKNKFKRVTIYTHKYDHVVSGPIWIMPGLNGFKVNITHLNYPTFEEMLYRSRKNPAMCPLDGVGKKWGTILNEIAAQEPVKPELPPPPDPEPEVEPRTDGHYTCAYCFGSGCKECGGIGHFDYRPVHGRGR